MVAQVKARTNNVKWDLLFSGLQDKIFEIETFYSKRVKCNAFILKADLLNMEVPFHGISAGLTPGQPNVSTPAQI